ncbi:MAG: hypothetical protein WC356_05305 [Candidatus Micrarchaeia archaeon]|jgi:hypothetical protein
MDKKIFLIATLFIFGILMSSVFAVGLPAVKPESVSEESMRYFEIRSSMSEEDCNETYFENTYYNRWNMVSVPIDDSIYASAGMFPGHSGVYAYAPLSGDYYNTLTSYPSEGYFVLYNFATSIDVSSRSSSIANFTFGYCGTPITEKCYNVVNGWNLIGSIYEPVSLDDITLSSGILSDPQAYWYDPVSRTYQASSVIEPGKAYWVLVSNVTNSSALCLGSETTSCEDCGEGYELIELDESFETENYRVVLNDILVSGSCDDPTDHPVSITVYNRAFTSVIDHTIICPGEYELLGPSNELNISVCKTVYGVELFQRWACMKVEENLYGVCPVLDERVTVRISNLNTTLDWTGREGNRQRVGSEIVEIRNIYETLGYASPCGACPVLDKSVQIKITNEDNSSTTWTGREGDSQTFAETEIEVLDISISIGPAEPCDTEEICLEDITVTHPEKYSAIFEIIDDTTGSIFIQDKMDIGESYTHSLFDFNFTLTELAPGVTLTAKWAKFNIGGEEVVLSIGEETSLEPGISLRLVDLGLPKDTETYDFNGGMIFSILDNTTREVLYQDVATEGEDYTWSGPSGDLSFTLNKVAIGTTLSAKWAKIQVTPYMWYIKSIGEEIDMSYGASVPYILKVDDIDMATGDNERAVLHLTSATDDKRLTLATGESVVFDGKTIEVLEIGIGHTLTAKWAKLRITEPGTAPVEVVLDIGECY